MRNKYRIAAIMDEFTYNCFAPECELMQLTPSNYIEEIDKFNPDLFFIESAWRGKDDLWHFRLNDNMTDIIALTDYCRNKKIPIVFWSKEDPVHFGIFIRTAALADYVFTTDADCIEVYKSYLGHDRVYYLPFAAQPKIHNPVEEYNRFEKFCFAGSFYVKYKERSKAFLDLIPMFKSYGIDIYDRNYKKYDGDPNAVPSSDGAGYLFPAELRENVLGSLPYNEIARAYKGYKYGINMTSMVQSGYMFARRVFELMASNTVTVSNYSRGLELFFGDLLPATNNPDYMKYALKKYCKDEISYRKYRLAGLRHVLSEHLYENRLDRICRIAINKCYIDCAPLVLVVTSKDNEIIRNMFNIQTYKNKKLVVCDVEENLLKFDFDFITVFSDKNYYGKNYLTDLVLATKYSDSVIIGKSAYYKNNELINKQNTYKNVKDNISVFRSIIKRSFFDQKITLKALLELRETHDMFSIDEFNFFEDSGCSEIVDDIDIYTGIPIEKIYSFTDRIPAISFSSSRYFSIKELFDNIEIAETDLTEKNFDNGIFTLIRNVEDDTIVWLRVNKFYDISNFTSGSRLGIFTKSVERTGMIRCQIEYYDDNNNKLDFLNFQLDGFSLLRISDHAKKFKLVFRIRGKASVSLKEIYASQTETSLPAIFPTRRNVLFTNEYPDYNNRKNASALHTFASKHNLEVLKLSDEPVYLPYSEYEGVQIISIQTSAISEYISKGNFDCIYTHEIADEAKEVLQKHCDKVVEI